MAMAMAMAMVMDCWLIDLRITLEENTCMAIVYIFIECCCNGVCIRDAPSMPIYRRSRVVEL